MKECFRITVEQLRTMVDQMENEIKYGSMTGVVYVTIQHHPNGRPILQFEQPCGYAECNSHYTRFNGELT